MNNKNSFESKIIEAVISLIKNECQNSKDCKGCQFNKFGNCRFYNLPKDWKLAKDYKYCRSCLYGEDNWEGYRPCDYCEDGSEMD